TFSQSSGFAPESNPPSPECLLHLAFSLASLSFLVEPRCLRPYRARTDRYEAVILVFLGLGEERKGFGNTQKLPLRTYWFTVCCRTENPCVECSIHSLPTNEIKFSFHR